MQGKGLHGRSRTGRESPAPFPVPTLEWEMGNVWETGMRPRAYLPLSAAPAGSGFAASGARASSGLCGCEETLQTRPRHEERRRDPRGISPVQSEMWQDVPEEGNSS